MVFFSISCFCLRWKQIILLHLSGEITNQGKLLKQCCIIRIATPSHFRLKGEGKTMMSAVKPEDLLLHFPFVLISSSFMYLSTPAITPPKVQAGMMLVLQDFRTDFKKRGLGTVIGSM